MCGRLNVVSDPLCQLVSDVLGITFTTPSNADLCPSQTVATIIKPTIFQQLDATWGFQTSWSDKLLINAQAETVNEKPTFKAAFAHSRCLIPCTGWYEWKTERGKKIKYSFSHVDNQPFLMAGILYNPQRPQLVTLTTSPNTKCSEIHQRMPVLIAPENIEYWFNANPNQLMPIMTAADEDIIKINR